jgi:hypothetical protein
MLARLRRKDMERERRKAIRNAYRRVREAKKKKDPEVIMSLFIILHSVSLAYDMPNNLFPLIYFYLKEGVQTGHLQQVTGNSNDC